MSNKESSLNQGEDGASAASETYDHSTLRAVARRVTPNGSPTIPVPDDRVNFGSIQSYLESKGVLQTEPSAVDETAEEQLRKQYIYALRSVNAETDGVLTASDMDARSQYDLGDITATFGGWQAALDAAGIDIHTQICTEIQRVTEELGHPPSPAELNEAGRISSIMVTNCFESYEDALEAATATDSASTYRELPKRWLRRVEWPGFAAPLYDRVRGRRQNAATGVEDGDEFDRRTFLKYAGLSATVAAGVSSSDALYGRDGGRNALAGGQYGYGGVPVNAPQETGAGVNSTGTPTPAAPGTPTQTATPAATSTTATPTSTEPATDTSPPTATESSDASTGGADDNSATDDSETTTPSATDDSETTTPTDSGSDSTTTTTPTSVDRYYDEFEDYGQGYGEQGYGGVQTS